jgi:hypothetical protein
MGGDPITKTHGHGRAAKRCSPSAARARAQGSGRRGSYAGEELVGSVAILSRSATAWLISCSRNDQPRRGRCARPGPARARDPRTDADAVKSRPMARPDFSVMPRRLRGIRTCPPAAGRVVDRSRYRGSSRATSFATAERVGHRPRAQDWRSAGAGRRNRLGQERGPARAGALGARARTDRRAGARARSNVRSSTQPGATGGWPAISPGPRHRRRFVTRRRGGPVAIGVPRARGEPPAKSSKLERRPPAS